MRNAQAEAAYLQLVFHDDKDTPSDFIADLARSVFSLPAQDAIAFSATVERLGKAVCGTYPRAVAEVLLQTARNRIKAAGHSMRITTKGGNDIGLHDCTLCGILVGGNKIDLANETVFVCDDCTYAVASKAVDVFEKKQFTYAEEALDWHFAGNARDELAATSRQFPGHMGAEPRSTDCSRNRRSASSASTSGSATRH
jgi:ATP-dependent Clp protease adapter protein ClpS